MACEKLYILIVKRMKIEINRLNFFTLASDHGISGIIPFEVSVIRNQWTTPRPKSRLMRSVSLVMPETDNNLFD